MYNKVNSILYIGKNQNYISDFGLNKVLLKSFRRIETVLEASNFLFNKNELPDIVFIDSILNSMKGSTYLKMLRKFKKFDTVIFILLDNLPYNKAFFKNLLKKGIDDVVPTTFSFRSFQPRFNFLIEYRKYPKYKKKSEIVYEGYKISSIKRAFDIVFSIVALTISTPILLFSALAIKIESKGPIFYSSKRIGTGYKLFDFYKLRSMKINADKELKKLKKNNQYKTDESKINIDECENCERLKSNCSELLYIDGKTICENQYLKLKKVKNLGTFIKISDDPRVTKVGKFLRNTSIDELPQFFNVLKGDMSIVGNRPLPLYEAEQLTTDKCSLRFLAPSGITGLWQVEKRGSHKMNEEERKNLDNIYAVSHNFIYDLKLILRTIPALIQKENV